MPMKVRYTTVDGEVISESRAGVERDYVPDPLGSTVALLNSSQTITDTFSYWPYGESKSRTGTTATPFQFVGTLGYYQDSSTRNYVRARHLRKDLTRWMTEDPIGFEGGDLNLLRYSATSPTSNFDPQGTIALLPIIIIGGAGLVYGAIYARNCYQTANAVKDEMMEWPHNHSGTPRGGDKLVHCMTVCLIGKRAGMLCARKAIHSSGDCKGQPGADLLDHDANEKGYDCSFQGQTGNDWLDCQKCCHDKGYRRWR